LRTESRATNRKRGSEEPEQPYSHDRGPLLTKREAAAYLAVTERMMNRLTYEYGLRRRKIGGRNRYHIDDLNDLIEKSLIDPDAK
jgi:hypothetical protein